MILATLLTFILATVDLSRYLATRAAFQFAIAEVARQALVTTSLRTDNAAAKTLALSRAALLDTSGLTITMTADNANNRFRVEGTYSFQFAIGVFGVPNRTLRSTVVHAF